MTQRSSTISARDYESIDLNIRTLRVFLAVEEAGSMVAAARALGTSKSTVSQHISNLEQAIGTALLDRGARPLTLTPAGHVFRRHALSILGAVSTARAELVELDVSTLSRIRLGIIDDLDATLTPELVQHLSKLYPGSVFTACSGLSDALTRMLVRREVDIVVTGRPPQDEAVFEAQPLLREPFLMVCRKGLLNGVDDVLGTLRELPFVRYNATVPMGRAIELHLNRVGLSLPERFAFDASRSVFAMLLRCDGWAITTPLGMLDSERFRARLDVHPLPFAGFTRTLSLVTRRDELGQLPTQLANLARSLLREQLIKPVRSLAPWVVSDFRVFDIEAPRPPSHSGSKIS